MQINHANLDDASLGTPEKRAIFSVAVLSSSNDKKLFSSHDKWQTTVERSMKKKNNFPVVQLNHNVTLCFDFVISFKNISP